jgi:hypothetical protein
MRHDRFGDEIEDDDSVPDDVFAETEESETVPHVCDRGFVDRDADPPLKPCLICRPDLAPEVLRLKAFGPEREDDPRPDPLNTRRNLETS